MKPGRIRWVVVAMALGLSGCPEVTPPPDEPDSTNVGDEEPPQNEPDQEDPDQDDLDDEHEPVDPGEADPDPGEADPDPIDEPEHE